VVLKNTTWVAWQNSPLVVKNHCTHLPAHSARSVVPELFNRSQGLHAAPEVVKTLWPEGQMVGRATTQFAKAVCHSTSMFTQLGKLAGEMGKMDF